MLLQHRRASDPRPSEITPEALFRGRRRLLKGAGAVAAGSLLGAMPAFAEADPFASVPRGPYATDEAMTPFESITTYNNFYEFGTGKEDPSANAGSLRTRPWTIEVGGLVAKPQTIDIESLLADYGLEERIYRLRCVEAWSMVIPWVGFPLSKVLDKVEPLGSARYVAFQTLLDPQQMPGQQRPVLDWPYKEGLRLDEARHPLTILSVGLYGKVLPNQNGAPVRVVVPWKYGFKSAKSIVKITLVQEMPPTAWNTAQPMEYGFYSNVNPEVDHPRWSQAKERRIGEFFKRETLPFNGYAEQVASLYDGMDLRQWF